MLNRLLEYNYSAVGIFFFITLLKLALYFTGQVNSGDYCDSLFNIPPQPSIAGGLLSALATTLLGVFILINSERHAKRTHFSYWLVLLFALLMSLDTHYAFSVEYIGLFFFILSLFFFMKSTTDFNKSSHTTEVFNIGICLGIGVLFTPHLIYTLPLLMLCSLALGTANIRDLLAIILGFTIPFVIINALIFAFFSERAEYVHTFIIERLFNGSIIAPLKFNLYNQAAAIGSIIILVYSLYLTFTKTYKVKIVTRRFNTINLIILTYISIFTLLGIIPTHFGLMLLFIPSAYFYSNLLGLTTPAQQNLFICISFLSIALSYPSVIDEIISLYEMIF